MYRATAVNYLAQGADALYMMQLNWPSCTIDDEFRVLLCYCGELALMHRMPRHYFVTPHQEAAVEYDYTSPLPLALSPDSQTLPFFVGDTLPADFAAGQLNSVTLRLRISSVSTADEIEVKLNGVLLPSAGCVNGCGSDCDLLLGLVCFLGAFLMESCKFWGHLCTWLVYMYCTAPAGGRGIR